MPTKVFNESYATMTAGMAYKTPAFANDLMQLMGPNATVSLGHDGSGRLRISVSWTSVGTAVSPSSTFVMSADIWYYFELQTNITSGASPHVVSSARVNGAEIIAWDYPVSTGLLDQKLDRIHIVGPGGGYNARYDDLYVTDNEFLGDIKVGVLYPNAVGDSSGWTPNGAGANYTKVMEHPADDDVTYAAASAVGMKDLYHLDDIDPSFAGSIKGVQALWMIKKSDEGEAAAKGVWKSGGTEVVQTEGHNFLPPGGFHPSVEAYQYSIQAARHSLFTLSNWTKAELDALQLGVIRTV